MQAQACDSCHRRKSRCDKAKPVCAYCQKNQVPCIYTDRSKEPTFRKHHIDAVERRLRRAEARNKALLDELARSRATSDLPDQRSRAASLTPSSTTPSAPEYTPVRGDVMNEVTFLASTAAGERHYLGSTSGILFANLVRASIDVSNPIPASSDTRHTQHSQHSQHSQHLLNTSTTNRSRASQDIPVPSELAKDMVNAYLAHDHLCYPFLAPATLLSIVASIYTDASFYNNNPYESFVFDLVLAIATAHVYKFDWQMLPSAETHHTRAMSRINEVFQAGGLQSLHAILLLCQYRTGSSMQDTSASMWHLVGIAARIAFELGLHRESTYTSRQQDAENIESSDSLHEQEVRRRSFWCVFAMDRIASITLGRPLAICLEDIDVELPSPVNDHVFEIPLDIQEGDSSINRTAVFVHIIEYRLLCGKIMKTLHAPKRSNKDMENAYTTRDSLVAELDRWRQNTDLLGLSTMSQHRSSFRSHEWYDMLHCNAMLFLFRPSPIFTDLTKDSNSLQTIFQSAKQSITLYAYLHRSRKINYSWITLHSVFMAGLSYIYAISRHIRERRRRHRLEATLTADPSAIEIVNVTRACSNVLVAVSERWNALRHCHEVFDRLSDAVLADAIKLQSTTIVPQSPSGTHLGAEQYRNHEAIPMSTPSSGNFPNLPDGAISVPGPSSGLSPLIVDSEFHSCFSDLQHLYDQSYVDNPVMQLSQDWLGYIDEFNTIIPGIMPDEYNRTSY